MTKKHELMHGGYPERDSSLRNIPLEGTTGSVETRANRNCSFLLPLVVTLMNFLWVNIFKSLKSAYCTVDFMSKKQQDLWFTHT